MERIKGSIAILKMSAEIGSPCRKPLSWIIDSDVKPLMLKLTKLLKNKEVIVVMNCLGKLYHHNTALG